MTPKPPWLKRRLPTGPTFENLRSRLAENHIHTVCQEANCPNIWECFSEKTATFLILGDRCTRSCRFCAITSDTPLPPDTGETERIADTALEMKLNYIVITSVTRDDLPDGGAGHFADTINKVRGKMPGVRVEVLVPDFLGNRDALNRVMDASPSVLNHNLETVSSLYKLVRPGASYSRSLELLERASLHTPEAKTKSGLMLGIGETDREVIQAMKDLRAVGCRILTLGQYLSPSRSHLPIKRYVTPEEFDLFRLKALDIGFEQVASGPFVRSSYHAKSLYGPAPDRKSEI